MNGPIVNIADVELQPRPPALAPTGELAERYDARVGFLGARIGAQKLGCSLTAIPPGKRAFPFHNHRVNEEMFFILEGSGELRFGDTTYPVRAGDVVACPAGGREVAHQFINTGTTELRFIGVSTQLSADLCEYPDSGRFGVIGQFPGADGKPESFSFIGQADQSLNYWEGN